MLTTTDVMAGKAVVQLGLATADVVQAALVDLDRNGGLCLTARLAEQGALSPADAQRAQTCAERYEEVWAEGIYLRQLEKATGMSARAVAALLAETELEGAPLGAWLLREQSITPEQDAAIRAKQARRLEKEAKRIVDRYRGERFEGVARPLVQAKRLDPAKFKISALFRSKAMRELVSKARKQLKSRPPRPKPEPRVDYTFDPNAAPRVTPPAAAPALAEPPVAAPAAEAEPPIAAPAAAAEPPIAAPAAAAEPPIAAPAAAAEPPTGAAAAAPGVSPPVAESGGLGKSLRVLLDGAKTRGLPPDLTRRVFAALLRAFVPLHAAGQVHGDVRPETVFVRPRDMHVSLVPGERQAPCSDAADPWARLQGLASDPPGAGGHAAPEVIGRRAIDGRADLYSLGVLLFELLSGQLPFHASTPREAAGQHLVVPPLTLSEADPSRLWPWALEDLLARLLSKQPEGRPSSAEALLGELEAGTQAAFAQIRAAARSA